ncbi:MAG: DUF493 family protein [Algiphilus sp.]
MSKKPTFQPGDAVPDEAVYTLPCTVPFKVFLRPDERAEQQLLQRCRAATAATIDCERQPSRNGNFVCLRLQVHATEMEHIAQVRAAIAADPSVLMAL